MRACLECGEPLGVSAALCLSCRRPSGSAEDLRGRRPTGGRVQGAGPLPTSDRVPDGDPLADEAGRKLRLFVWVVGAVAACALFDLGLSLASIIVLLASWGVGSLSRPLVELACLHEDVQRSHLRETQQLLDEHRRARGAPWRATRRRWPWGR